MKNWTTRVTEHFSLSLLPFQKQPSKLFSKIVALTKYSQNSVENTRGGFLLISTEIDLRSMLSFEFWSNYILEYLRLITVPRSSHWRYSIKRAVLKNFAIASFLKRLQHRCFPVNVAKFLRTQILINIS